MADSIGLLYVWVLLLVGCVLPTLFLYRNLGVLVGSHGFIATISSMVYAVCVRSGTTEVVAFALGLVVACVLGLIHIPILRATNRQIFLILSLAGHFFIAELWLSVPSITGGSGGLLLPASGSKFVLVFVYSGMVAVATFFARSLENRENAFFEFSTIRTLGPRAGSLGAREGGFLGAGFALFGLLVGAAGIVGARFSGYTAPGSFDVSWSIICVSIVLVATTRGLKLAALLCALYAALRIVVRHSLSASVTTSVFLDVMFPAVLLFVYAFNRGLVLKRRGR